MDYSVILPIQSIFHLYNQLYGTTTVVCCPMMLASWRGSLSYLYHPSEMQYDAVLHLGFLLVHLHKTLCNVRWSKCVAFYLNCVQNLEKIALSGAQGEMPEEEERDHISNTRQ